MVLYIASRMVGLLREVLIGAQFGTSAELDAYIAAFRIPDLLYQLIAGGALGSAFIPIFTGYLTQDDQPGAWRLASNIINIVTLVLSIAAALAAIFAPTLVAALIAPDFDAPTQSLTVSLMRTMLIAPVMFGASGLLMGALNAHKHFLLPAFAPVMYNLAIIAATIFLAPSLGVAGLSIGVVVGALLHLLIQLPALARVGARYMPVLDVRDASVWNVARLMGPRALGLAIVQLNFIVNVNLGSRLGAGAISALNFAWLLMLLPQGIFAQSIATAAFPTLAEQYARNQIDAMRGTLSDTLRAIIFLSVPAMIGLIVLREPIVQLILQRGEFNAASTQAVAFTLQFYALGLVAHSMLEITARAFYALHDTRTPVIFGMLSMGLNLILSLLLIDSLAQGGLALANSIATIIETSILFIIIRKRLGGIQGRRILATCIKSGLAAVAMSIALLLWIQRMPTSIIILGVGGILAGAIVYGVTSLVLRAEELSGVVGFIRRRLGR